MIEFHFNEIQLWFDVERGCNTTVTPRHYVTYSCGLMQKEDAIQLCIAVHPCIAGCGLMQKEDAIQRTRPTRRTSASCGLMQKEDAIQLAAAESIANYQLWFDVERGCNTTLDVLEVPVERLWFDVERGCNTTIHVGHERRSCCGLMQKEDAIQPVSKLASRKQCCGLMQKEDATYRVALRFAPELCFDVEGRSISFAAYKMKRSDVVVEACIIQPQRPGEWTENMQGFSVMSELNFDAVFGCSAVILPNR